MLNICVKHKKIIKNKAIHVIIHTGITQFKCSQCETDFNYIYKLFQLVIPFLAHAGEKILQCHQSEGAYYDLQLGETLHV